MNSVTIAANKRDGVGKTAVKAVRAEGRIPAVIYGNGASEPISVELSDLRHIIYTPDFKIAEISLNGKTEKCILKDYDCHPVSEEILHVDFLRLKDDVPVKVNIPIRFKGVSPGVKLGGKLIQQMRKVSIKTTPENLIDEVKVDISGVDLGGVLRVRDITVSDKVEILASGANPIATVEIPRALKSAAAAEAKAAKTAAKK